MSPSPVAGRQCLAARDRFGGTRQQIQRRTYGQYIARGEASKRQLLRRCREGSFFADRVFPRYSRSPRAVGIALNNKRSLFDSLIKCSGNSNSWSRPSNTRQGRSRLWPRLELEAPNVSLVARIVVVARLLPRRQITEYADLAPEDRTELGFLMPRRGG